jgi:cobalt/nickel transport system permease protein
VLRDHLLSPYQPGSSVLHRSPAYLKAGAALASVVFVVLLPRDAWWTYAVVACVLAVMSAVARLAPGPMLLRLLVVEPLVIGIALLALTRPDGFVLFLSMLSKSTLCLACMILLTATTRFSELLRVLRRLHVPGLLVTTLALMYRFLFVLVDERERMQRARQSRTFNDGRSAAWQGSAQVAGRLFVRASERAERIYFAMCARGWRN